MANIEQEFNKAVEKFHAGLYKPAEKILLKINKIQAEIPDVLHILAFIAMETDRPKTAAKYLSQAIKKVPENAGLLNLLGCAHHKTGNVNSAIEAFSKAVSLEPGLANATFNLANALQDADRLEEAAVQYQRYIEFAPDDANGHKGLGRVQWDMGRHDTAFKAFTAALECDPDDADNQINMGTALAHNHNLEDAQKHLSRAVELNPEMLKAKVLLADVIHRIGNTVDAISVIEKALSLTPESQDLHLLLGRIYQDVGQIENAQVSFELARRLQPDNAEILSSLSGLLEKSSKLEQALDVVTEGLKTAPDHFGLNLNAAKIACRTKEFKKALSILHSMRDDLAPLELRRDRSFELGRVYDRLEDADKAYEFYTNGNELAALTWRAQNINKQEVADYVGRHLDTVNEPWVSSWPPPYSGHAEERSPVFMIGFPRSGTTLVDQILDSHPSIQVLEELPLVEKARNFLENNADDYPDIIARLSDDEIAHLRRMYFETADQCLEREEGSLLIDKMPLNTVEVALIHRLFPEAKFILSLRHPCDVCLSCFMQSFELNASMSNFLTLQETANLYERVMTLWQRYESLLTLSVFRIRYEDLVDDLEGSSRDLMAFLGLPWDDAVLDYNLHAATRNIHTPSYSQVTQKIYTRSRYRWLRYEKYLTPMLNQLQPFIDEFGYGDSE